MFYWYFQTCNLSNGKSGVLSGQLTLTVMQEAVDHVRVWRRRCSLMK